MLPPEAASLVLLAALFHASWNAVVKIGGDRLAVLAIVNGTGAMVCLLALPLVAAPAAPSWPYLAASVALHLGYYYGLVKAYSVGDLSQVYPLARGLSPILVVAGALVFAGERPPMLGLVGVGLACAGILSLAFEGGPPWRRDRAIVGYALMTSGFIAAYTVVDGLGVRLSGSTAGYIVWLFALDGLPLTLFAWLRRRGQLRAVWRVEWRKGVAGGLLALAAYAIVIWALAQGAMAAVSALRETSVIFAAFLGAVLLRERVGALRVVAAVLVAVGVVLMKVV